MSPQLSILNLYESYGNSRQTPLDIAIEVLKRIQDDSINCNSMASFDPDDLMEQARASAKRWKQNKPLGMLDGIPVAIKDVLDVKGYQTRFGSPAMADVDKALVDCEAVRRLREAGAMITGKTRTWEFAWRADPVRRVDEVVRNPQNQFYSTGGSSSGSAAAVAAGLCSVALGTDSGGSVRGPAAFCGIVGLKAGHGCVPVVPASPMAEFEHIGVIANTVEDSALTLNSMSGYHPDDDSSWPYSTLDIDVSEFKLSKARAAFNIDLTYCKAHPSSVSAFEAAITCLQNCGLDLLPIDLSFPRDFDLTDRLYDHCALNTVQLVNENKRSLVSEEVLKIADRARTRTNADYHEARQVRAQCCQVFNQVFEDFDVLICLTQESTANQLDQPASMMKFTRCFDMTGQPAISIPIGFGENNLPVGLQIIANKGKEKDLLMAAHWMERQLLQVANK